MKNKFLHIAALLAVISFFFFACEEGPNYVDYSNYYPQATAISLNPVTGFPGQEVIITGTKLDTLKGAVKVWFGGISAIASDIVKSNGTEIVVKVPENAVSGLVDLQVWTTKIENIGSFIVMPKPAILSVTSEGITENIAMPGDIVTIAGENFLTQAENVFIDFNGTPALEIVSLTSSLIKVKAPKGYTAGAINVTFNGNFKLIGSALSPGISPGDVSIIFLKNYMQPFTANNMNVNQAFSGSNWATPDFWEVNDAAQNQINAGAVARCGGAHFGKPNMANIGELAFQAGWGDAIGNVFSNGKMYQITTLPAGSYRVDIEIKESGFKNYKSSSAVYLVVANGTTLPDLVSADAVPAPALASVVVQDGVSYNGANAIQSVTFTISESTQVSIGFVGTMVANSYVRFNYLKLALLE